MPYNTSYFPVNYQPIYPQYQPQVQQQQVQPQVQQNGFVRVQSENEARMYPVAPGNSITFIDENAPYCYTKTMDFSQLDRPKFEKYRLVKEEDAITGAQTAPVGKVGTDIEYALKSDVDALRSDLDAIKAKMTQKKSKRRDDEDEDYE